MTQGNAVTFEKPQPLSLTEMKAAAKTIVESTEYQLISNGVGPPTLGTIRQSSIIRRLMKKILSATQIAQ